MKTDFLMDESSNLIPGPIILTPEIFLDDRGTFLESWNKKQFNALVNLEVNFVQDNESYSKKGTLRGLHYQLKPFSQQKLVRAIKGEIYDVIVDLREDSKTFGKWAGIILNSELKNQLWIPYGFAHGFLTLSDEAIMGYKVTDYWAKDFERTLHWKDNKINIRWPMLENNLCPKLSEKDQKGNLFKELFDRGELF